MRPFPTWIYFLLVFTGCMPSGEDSWKHYIGGGHYSTRTPSVSPDGKSVVFSSPRTGQGDIYKVNVDGQNAVRLTNHPGFEATPLYSPDGTAIAFVRETNEQRHIWLMSSDGSNQRQLTFGKVLDDVGSFSPDGTKLIFWRSPLSFGMGRFVECFAIDLETQTVHKVEDSLQYSPDGEQAVFTVYAEQSEIWAKSADGSNKRRLARGHSPRFSSDGKTILYAADVGNPGRRWKAIETDGSSERDLGLMELPEFASDGKHIVYLSPTWEREVWKMDVDGSNRVRLNCPSGHIDFLRPCPTGFVFHLKSGANRVGEIYLINTNDWSDQRVTSME